MRRNEIPLHIPEVSPKILERVHEAAVVPNLTLVERIVSQRDNFARYLFRGTGSDVFEAVRIPLMHKPDDMKYVACVSCQVGCAMGCTFCATGRLGFVRNLAAWEIVDQVLKLQADSQHPVRGVVFMGMGEPMLNYDEVIRAARILSEPCGLAISGKAITISTVGIIAGIRRFTRDRLPFRLVVSLTSADAVKRGMLMPAEAGNPTGGVMAALREYHSQTGLRITLAWTMISGVNTSVQDAEQLGELIKGLPVKLDLIDVNDPTGRFVPPKAEELRLFRDALRVKTGVPVARRYSGGQDINAACGMLAGTAR